MANEQIYVYESLEVIMTGRIATRQLRNKKVMEIFEIKPVNPQDGSWKKWVQKKDLYKVQ